MKQISFTCGNCNWVLPVRDAELLRSGACPHCKQEAHVVLFPAYAREASVEQAERVLLDDQSTCFFHPESQALVPCDACGRFICAVCDIEHKEQHFCSECFSAATRKEDHTEFQKGFVRYDELAVSIAIISTLIFYLSIITAPLVLFMCVYHWKKPVSVLPVTRWRYVVAMMIAGIQLTLWVIGGLTMYSGSPIF